MTTSYLKSLTLVRFARCTRRRIFTLFAICVSLCFIHSSANCFAQEPKLDAFGNPVTEDDGDSLIIDREKEKSIVTRLYNAAEDAAAAQAALAELPKSPTELELRALRNMDRELSPSIQPEHVALVSQAVLRLGKSGDPTSLQYLHKVFDSQPERRTLIASSIAQLALEGPRRPHDWPMLLRTLPILDGEPGRIVAQALLKYRDRALNPSVQRNMLLLGMKLGSAGGEDALAVLAYWTNENPAASSADLPAKFAAWQAWYAKKYPHLPPPNLPHDNPTSPHKYRELAEYLRPIANHPGDIQRGAQVFEKAQCIKCHRAGERGEKVGPNLTKVVQRLTSQEIVESILFPSQQIFDQYSTKQLVLNNGQVFTGLVGEEANAYVLLQLNAEKRTIPKSEVQEINDSPLSAMPEGLFDKFTREDAADLLAYLHHVADD